MHEHRPSTPYRTGPEPTPGRGLRGLGEVALAAQDAIERPAERDSHHHDIDGPDPAVLGGMDVVVARRKQAQLGMLYTAATGPVGGGRRIRQRYCWNADHY